MGQSEGGNLRQERPFYHSDPSAMSMISESILVALSAAFLLYLKKEKNFLTTLHLSKVSKLHVNFIQPTIFSNLWDNCCWNISGPDRVNLLRNKKKFFNICNLRFVRHWANSTLPSLLLLSCDVPVPSESISTEYSTKGIFDSSSKSILWEKYMIIRKCCQTLFHIFFKIGLNSNVISTWYYTLTIKLYEKNNLLSIQKTHPL